MKNLILFTLSTVTFFLFLSGCAASRSELKMAYAGEVKRNAETAHVSVLFIFSHIKQMEGWDAIPKIESKYERLRSFDDIFLESKNELSNLGRYSTYLEEASDISDLKKRDMRDSLMKVMDYTVKFRIETKSSFAKYFFSGFISSVTLSLVPASYTKHYTVKAEVLNRNNELLSSYERKADVSNWYQMFLMFAYPFHPEIRKVEEVHLDFLKDIFRQMESEGVLKKY